MADATVALSNSPPKLEPGPQRRTAKRAAIYTRVSTADQHPETQLYDLREMAKQRGYEIVHEYGDVICGAKSKRPGLDQLMADARRHRFDIVLVAGFDRVARSVRHFLGVLDELNHLRSRLIGHLPSGCFCDHFTSDNGMIRLPTLLVLGSSTRTRSVVVPARRCTVWRNSIPVLRRSAYWLSVNCRLNALSHF